MAIMGDSEDAVNAAKAEIEGMIADPRGAMQRQRQRLMNVSGCHVCLCRCCGARRAGCALRSFIHTRLRLHCGPPRRPMAAAAAVVVVPCTTVAVAVVAAPSAPELVEEGLGSCALPTASSGEFPDTSSVALTVPPRLPLAPNTLTPNYIAWCTAQLHHRQGW